MKSLFVLVFLVSSTACQTGIVPISQRELYEKEGKTPTASVKRPIETKSEPGQEIFVKKENTTIVAKEVKNHTGSLFSLNNQSGFLYTPRPRALLSDFVDVVVDVNRKESGEQPQGSNAPTSGPGSPGQAAPKDELIAALPNLAPSTEKAKVPNVIKMQVIKELENGDVILEAKRSSINDQEAHAIQVLSRLPVDKKNTKDPIRLSDLTEVSWTETKNGNLIQRESSLWEDEYTLRWSDFDEARSKNAVDLENKRKELEKVKTRLEDRIVNLGKERNQVVKEKESAAKAKADSEQKVNEMTKKIEEQNLLIEQQKEMLKKQEEALNSMKQAPKDSK